MDKEKLMLYSPGISPRLRYIANHLINGILGIDLHITGNMQEIPSSGVPLINYSSSGMPGAVNICPHGILEETGIRRQDIDIVIDNGIPAFFNCNGECDLGFDIFAASFYLLSRYEEYLPFRRDFHGRFPYSESLAQRYSVVEYPLVELWTMKLKDYITIKYPGFKFPEKRFSWIPTIDVDIPWAYRNRGYCRTAGGFARSLLRADPEDFMTRYNVLFKGESDPYDTYGIIGEMHSGLGMSPVYFFSLGGYGNYDKSVSAQNPEYRELIRSISENCKTGIHPSYRSFDDPLLLVEEMEEFAAITGRGPCRSRQHYLRLGLPESYRLLIRNGIYEDYTMGWPETPGFRAGTCNPFMFYDLEVETVTSLRIFPFQIMDGSLRDYLKLEPAQAEGHAARIAEKIRQVNGILVTLWHNESFSESRRWKGWNKVYHEIAKTML
jgi:hypothetical protein